MVKTNDYSPSPIERTGTLLLVFTLLLFLVNCVMLPILSLLLTGFYLDLTLGLALGLLVAEFFVAAGVIAWGPFSLIKRVLVVFVAACLSAASASAGMLIGPLFLSKNSLGFFPWQGTATASSIVQFMIVSTSLPCLLIRYSRRWQLGRNGLDVSGSILKPNRSTNQRTGLVGISVLLLISISLLVLAQQRAGFNWRATAELIGIIGAMMFLLGVVIMLPLSWKLLSTENYLRVSTILLLTSSIIIGPSISVVAFLVYRPFNIGFINFLFTQEFVYCTSFFFAFFFSITTFAIAVRMIGYSLVIPKFAARKTNYEQNVVPHPLDD